MNTLTLDEVKSLAQSGEYKKIPLTRQILSDLRTPLEVLRIMQNISDHCFLLESVEDQVQWGRYTFLGFDPDMELTCTDHKMCVNAGGRIRMMTAHPAKYIRQLIRENRSPCFKDMPPFTGGLVGYFSYDYIKYSEPTLKLDEKNEYGFSDMDLMLFNKLIAFDNLAQKIIIIVNISTSNPEIQYNKGMMELDNIERLILEGVPRKIPEGRLLSNIKPKFSREEYCRKVEQVKKYIKDGDIFQLVLSNPMQARFKGSLLNTYRILRTTNPSPYMFYFSGDIEIAGASPETLVKVTDGEIRTFPLAGTRPRGRDYAEDKRLEEELLADEKERAEHNMLVDLGRNDIGRLSEFGSVKVEKYMSIERYSHVMHIGSAVKGKMREEFKAVDAIDSVLPAGTLSGAPKIRACEIINELEGDKRGIYGGAIGYVDFAGNLDTCIGIRLAFKKNGRVFVRSGAGIVADSVPEREYQECLNKARAVVEALKGGA